MSNSSITEEDIAPFNTITTILVQPMANLTVMLYVYGIYTVLFVISLQILICQQDRPNRRLYIFFTTVLFTLNSLHNIVQILIVARQATLEFTFTKNQDWASFWAYLKHDDVKTIMAGFEITLPLCLVITTDLMLLHRCYVIWGSSKWIAFPLIFVILSLAICETVSIAFIVIGASDTTDPAKRRLYFQGNIIDSAFWLANMAVNMILTLLTAGRIWWISREARKHLGPAIKTKYNTIVAIILESGILYAIFLTTTVVYELLADPEVHGLAPFSFFVIVYQVAGIAPTLIIIRAAAGKTIEQTSMNQVVSSLHFANEAGLGSGNLDTRSFVQTVDIEASSLAERTENLGKEQAA
ncbi:hypothetical protein Moror_11685 [Moniliophthora roreri MCA 2997]|uniref:Uncharacterized protein n=1 Tax=Moniliophthora roreri (strain MCA 2997) TaxID=1381753 RepID=V2X0M6_MONRO|nr:hypothetical protein Moror_11685 [Moniliophthora roreri MCA 2997]